MCGRSRWLSCSIPCTQTPTILPKDFQDSNLHAQIWLSLSCCNLEHPEIANTPANISRVLSQISRIQWDQLNSLSSLCFLAQFHSVHVSCWSSCCDDGKDKSTPEVKRPQPPKPQTTELNRKIFLKCL